MFIHEPRTAVKGEEPSAWMLPRVRHHTALGNSAIKVITVYEEERTRMREQLKDRLTLMQPISIKQPFGLGTLGGCVCVRACLYVDM